MTNPPYTRFDNSSRSGCPARTEELKSDRRFDVPSTARRAFAALSTIGAAAALTVPTEASAGSTKTRGIGPWFVAAQTGERPPRPVALGVLPVKLLQIGNRIREGEGLGLLHGGARRFDLIDP